ncbi:zinc metalloprotease [Cellulophaga sp. Hel_I_12]|uniref:zinc metalloprotease n=1 Tax=Cellulophaga sp. Hel_I_12 TaxID=1249972 RepID=UPI000648864D|nr:zinc metalloprotease [Cellulophaga sp. Hel_I_12]
MKKVVLGLATLAMVYACQNDQIDSNINELQEVQIDMSDFTLLVENEGNLTGKSDQGVEKCHSMNNLAYRLESNPSLSKKMYDIEYNTRKAIALKANSKGKPGGGSGGGGGTTPTIFTGAITIPVVINIIESSPGKVTDAQINSQIAILNEDFNNNNSRTSGIPSEFSSAVADIDITFTRGNVIRKTSSVSSWGTNDAMKFASQGGIDATDTANNLNIWVCEIGGGILGYAQFPGGTAATDGIVIGTDFFGETNAGGVYGNGRTATHEVGHWLNLRHIWGDGRCNRDDFVADTPTSDAPNYNCPSYPTVNCRSTDMTMNYMDYVQDDCMYMFTNGQNDRMRTLFVSGGPREGFVN